LHTQEFKGDLGSPSGEATHASQFSLGPSVSETFKTWQPIKVDAATEAVAHPTLNTTQVVDGEKSLTLLGCMLDPLEPQADDSTILRRLLAKISDPADVLEATKRLGGRWILILRNNDQKFLFIDALGMRQVFYTDPAHTQSVWAFSHPKLAERTLGLTMDDTAQRYMDSYVWRSDPEYRWPVASTPYREVRRLLPNHYLDLNTGACHRYWPDRPLGRRRLEDAIEEISVLMRGLLKAAAHRFDLAIAVTAGIDSRLVWAACKEIRQNVSFITLRKARDPDNYADFDIPARLASNLGLDHTVIKASGMASAEFSGAFKENVFLAHDHYAADAEAILKQFSRAKVVITGSGGETARCYYGSRIPGYRRITPEYLAILDVRGSEFALQHYRGWLEQLGETYGLDVLDLFYWENRTAWLAMTALEFDIAWRDNITPFNCRDVLTTMLAVNERYREPPDYQLFRRLIGRIWPELLSEPFNPHLTNPRTRFKELLKMTVKHAVITARRVLPRH